MVATVYSELSWISHGALTEVLDLDTGLRRRMHEFALLRLRLYKQEGAAPARPPLPAPCAR